jgi:molybdopterin/thiamine biosynthesis adenylyltransferase
MTTTTTLSDALRMHSHPAKLPDQSEYRSIGGRTIFQLATQFHLTPIEVEQAALINNVVPERYARNFKTYSLMEQVRLLRSTVAVVGLGGLGGTVVEILARTGVGCMHLIDGDSFAEHNLNRQLTSNCRNLGTPKSYAAQNRVATINPSLKVHVHSKFLNAANAARLINSADVIVDCLDNIKTRFILAKSAKIIGCPMVSAAVGGLYGHVTTIFPDDENLDMIYGEESASPSTGAETSLGCLPQIVMMIAAIQSSEVFKLLLQRGRVLRNRLLVVDLEDNTLETLQLC